MNSTVSIPMPKRIFPKWIESIAQLIPSPGTHSFALGLEFVPQEYAKHNQAQIAINLRILCIQGPPELRLDYCAD